MRTWYCAGEWALEPHNTENGFPGIPCPWQPDIHVPISEYLTFRTGFSLKFSHSSLQMAQNPKFSLSLLVTLRHTLSRQEIATK